MPDPYRILCRGLFLSAVIALGTASDVRAQFDRMLGLPTNQASKRNRGSARGLSGSVTLYHIFAQDEESSWPKRHRRIARRKICAACDFLMRQARRYRTEVAFTQRTHRVTLDFQLPTDLAADPEWTETAIRQAASFSANDLVARLKERDAADHVLVVLHVNKPGISYNLSYSKNIDPAYRAERVVCFSRFSDEVPTPAASYAHEILHAFGAGELYFPFDVTDSRKQVAERMFPDDVMLRVDGGLGQLSVGRYTAYRVGWLRKLERSHRIFED